MLFRSKAGYVKDFPESEKLKYLDAALKDRDRLRTTISDVIGSYSEQRCRTISMKAPS